MFYLGRGRSCPVRATPLVDSTGHWHMSESMCAFADSERLSATFS
jgi:hypothetical protein